MEKLNLNVTNRTITGKKVKTLRNQGLIPMNMFGHRTDSQALQCDLSQLNKILPVAGTNIPISINIDGETKDASETICFVRDLQWDPISDKLLHVDLYRVDTSRTVTIEVPITLTGTSDAIINMGGTLIQPVSSVTVQGLPLNIPREYVLDISALDSFDKSILISDLETDDSIELMNPEDQMLARVLPPRIEEEPVVETEEGEEGIEGEEGEEGTEELGGEQEPTAGEQQTQ
jgi:large subunit ribosomal protein L25